MDGDNRGRLDASTVAFTARLETPFVVGADIGASAFERGDILDLRWWRSCWIRADRDQLVVVREVEISMHRSHLFWGIEEQSRNVELGDHFGGAGGGGAIFVIDFSRDFIRDYFVVFQAHGNVRAPIRRSLR